MAADGHGWLWDAVEGGNDCKFWLRWLKARKKGKGWQKVGKGPGRWQNCQGCSGRWQMLLGFGGLNILPEAIFIPNWMRID